MQFQSAAKAADAITEIQVQYNLPEGSIRENTAIMGLAGQSSNDSMQNIYRCLLYTSLLNISETKDVDKVDNIDTMIVLGAKVNGTEVSNTLKLRLDRCV